MFFQLSSPSNCLASTKTIGENQFDFFRNYKLLYYLKKQLLIYLLFWQKFY